MKKRALTLIIALAIIISSIPISAVVAETMLESSSILSNKFSSFSEEIVEMIGENDSEQSYCYDLKSEGTQQSASGDVKAASDTSKSENNIDFSTKRLIVKSAYKLKDYGASSKVEGFFNLHVFQYDTEEQTERAYNEFLKLKDKGKVVYVEPDVEYSAKDLLFDDNKVNEDGPIDNLETSFNSWGAEKMGVDLYQDYLIKKVSADGTAKSLPQVVVAVVDTGIDPYHEIFNGYYDKNTNPEGRLLKGKDFSWTANDNVNGELHDVVGHGTHVSGTITELTLSNVKILPVKVFADSFNIPEGKITDFLDEKEPGMLDSLRDDFRTTALIISLGMIYAAQHADIINMSLGGPFYLINDVANAIFLSGKLIVAGSGNFSSNALVMSPAGALGSLTVSSVNENLKFSYFSNFGNTVDVVAPGEKILSAKSGGGYLSASGTSMSTPHVSGLAALFKTANYKLKATGLAKKIKESAYDLGEKGKDVFYGYGFAYAKVFDFIKLNFNNAPGRYSEPVIIHISSSDPDARIFYTLDGTEPSKNSIEYNNDEGIEIESSATLRAVAYRIFEGKYYRESVSEIKGDFNIDGSTSDCYKLIIDDSGTLQGFTGILMSDLIIPEEIDGITVRNISYDAFDENKELEKITLPDTIESINVWTFLYCENLKEINMSDGNEVFCTVDGVLYNKEKSVVIFCPRGKSGDLEIPEGVKKLETYAFYETQLDRIFFPDSMEEIKYLSILSIDKELVLYGNPDGVVKEYVKNDGGGFLLFFNIKFKDTIIDKMLLVYVKIANFVLTLPF